jgi:hypothetical protein
MTKRSNSDEETRHVWINQFLAPARSLWWVDKGRPLVVTTNSLAVLPNWWLECMKIRRGLRKTMSPLPQEVIERISLHADIDTGWNLLIVSHSVQAAVEKVSWDSYCQVQSSNINIIGIVSAYSAMSLWHTAPRTSRDWRTVTWVSKNHQGNSSHLCSLHSSDFKHVHDSLDVETRAIDAKILSTEIWSDNRNILSTWQWHAHRRYYSWGLHLFNLKIYSYCHQFGL